MIRTSMWIGFLLIVVAISLWFIVKAGYGVYAYFQLDTQIPITIEQWSVEQRKTDEFVVLAHYDFNFQGKSYQGVDAVGSVYPNPWAAKNAKQKFEKLDWTLWMNVKHPEKGVLEKHFPYKTTLSAFVLLGLTIYFSILGLYAGGKK